MSPMYKMATALPPLSSCRARAHSARCAAATYRSTSAPWRRAPSAARGGRSAAACRESRAPPPTLDAGFRCARIAPISYANA